MSFWKEKENFIGDGPLDFAHEFLKNCAEEYVTGIGRKPKLSEILRVLTKSISCEADCYLSDGDGIVVLEIKASTSRRPRKQRYKCGDIVAIPLSNGMFAFGHVTPQDHYVELFNVKSACVSCLTNLKHTARIRLPYTMSMEMVSNWEWRIIGNIPIDVDNFNIQHFLVAQGITRGDKYCLDKDGFIVPDMRLERASENELKSFPQLKIYGKEVVSDIEDRLRNSPVI